MRRSGLLSLSLSLSLSLLLAAADASAAEAGPPKARRSAVLFIFDASGSMLRPVKGRPKDAVARAVMADVLKALPSEVQVGLITFGHRRKRDCTDLEVAAPIGTERGAIAKRIASLKPQGETPLADAVRLAARQLEKYEGDASIVVVSDGKDECGGDPCAAAREAIAAGLHVRLHVVGFDVGRAEAEQLQCIAREGKGRYYSASDASQLAGALQEVEREVAPGAESQAVARCPPPARGSSKPVSCDCQPAAMKVGSVWGTDLYTDDSSVCRAALHAGVLTASGGKVTVYPYGGQDAYEGSERKGVYSSDYGAFAGSFGFSDALHPHTGGCPHNLVGYAGSNPPLQCECSAKATGEGSVWGTDVYTADSSICRAALHAGLLTAAGGTVKVYPSGGQDSYEGSERSGVVSTDYAAYGASFGFKEKLALRTGGCPPSFVDAPEPSKPLACECRPRASSQGSVWGTDVYTADSSICRAAVHAGVITASGGKVTVYALPGQASYAGTERRGVSSSSFGEYGQSFGFKPGK
jgi:LCCL domain/von Willebrand factor type A domain